MIEIIEPSAEIIKTENGIDILKRLESYGRTCYKSEENITENSARAFIISIIKRGHLSVIEHEKVSVRVICDRGVTHEIVRHRIGSYSQESTRYVNYKKRGIQFIRPFFFNNEQYKVWLDAVDYATEVYDALIEAGAKAEEARSVLPNSLKTEIIVTYNLREWRHFFELRCAPSAHPQMRQITIPLLNCMSDYIPVIFDDLKEKFCKGN